MKELLALVDNANRVFKVVNSIIAIFDFWCRIKKGHAEDQRYDLSKNIEMQLKL